MPQGSRLVLVTGASGYIAAHVVQQLQVAGYRVRGTVRSLKNEHKVACLVPDAKHKLDLVEADLTQDQGWNEAVAGCWAVIHLASFVPSLKAYQPEEPFMKAGVDGTLRVLNAASKAGVKKMVITSSFAAVTGDPAPWETGRTYTEDDWTDVDYPGLTFYPKGKTAAEKMAWKFVEDMPENSKLDLSVILPTFVLGPPLLKCLAATPSTETMIDLLNNKVPGCPAISVPICDVRDVAEAHIKCLTTAEAAGKRFIVFTKTEWMAVMAQMLNEELKPQGYSLYTNTLPYFAMWIASFFDKNMAKSNFLQKLGKEIIISNKRMVEVLGITPTDLRKTILDMAYALIDLGMVPRTDQYKSPTAVPN